MEGTPKAPNAGRSDPWNGTRGTTPLPFPCASGGRRRRHPTSVGPARSAHGCLLPSSATCFLDLLLFPSPPHSRSPLEPTVISTFLFIRFRRLEKPPGSQDNQGDGGNGSRHCGFWFCLSFLSLCWLHSASWPLCERRPGLTLPASRAPGWRWTESGLA